MVGLSKKSKIIGIGREFMILEYRDVDGLQIPVVFPYKLYKEKTTEIWRRRTAGGFISELRRRISIIFDFLESPRSILQSGVLKSAM